MTGSGSEDTAPAGGERPHGIDDLVPEVYEELKRVARQHLRTQDAATLCTTELVHEAYLKLARSGTVQWQGRAHFFGSAARAMRQVLVDFARTRGAAKRGGGARRVTLGDGDAAVDMQLEEILAVDEALHALERIDPRLRRIVELRFFAGLPVSEIASMLGISDRTVERDWLKARLLLAEVLDRS